MAVDKNVGSKKIGFEILVNNKNTTIIQNKNVFLIEWTTKKWCKGKVTFKARIISRKSAGAERPRVLLILWKPELYLDINRFEENHSNFMFLHLCTPDPLEVELPRLHLDYGVLHVREADGEDNVFRSLGPGTPWWRNPTTVNL